MAENEKCKQLIKEAFATSGYEQLNRSKDPTRISLDDTLVFVREPLSILSPLEIVIIDVHYQNVILDTAEIQEANAILTATEHNLEVWFELGSLDYGENINVRKRLATTGFYTKQGLLLADHLRLECIHLQRHHRFKQMSLNIGSFGFSRLNGALAIAELTWPQEIEDRSWPILMDRATSDSNPDSPQSEVGYFSGHVTELYEYQPVTQSAGNLPKLQTNINFKGPGGTYYVKLCMHDEKLARQSGHLQVQLSGGQALIIGYRGFGNRPFSK